MNNRIIRPMKPCKYEDWTPVFPCAAQLKLDGIRCIMYQGFAQSASGKPIPNEEVQLTAQALATAGFGETALDGELLSCHQDFRETSSIARSRQHRDSYLLRFYVFDLPFHSGSYEDRMKFLAWQFHLRNGEHNSLFLTSPTVPLRYLEAHVCSDQRDLDWYTGKVMSGQLSSQRPEGVIIRRLDRKYKQGRSTAKEGGLIKYKPFADAEARILRVDPLMRNENLPELDELGLTKRASCQSGKYPDSLMGSLHVELVTKGLPCPVGTTFSVGTGFSEFERIAMWKQRDHLPGRFIKFKYLPSGSYEKPRHPVFLGFRDPWDTTEEWD